MRILNLLPIVSLAIFAASCDAPPADESPVAPAVVCDEVTQNDVDSALECDEPVDAVADENIGDARVSAPETETP